MEHKKTESTATQLHTIEGGIAYTEGKLNAVFEAAYGIDKISSLLEEDLIQSGEAGHRAMSSTTREGLLVAIKQLSDRIQDTIAEGGSRPFNFGGDLSYLRTNTDS